MKVLSDFTVQVLHRIYFLNGWYHKLTIKIPSHLFVGHKKVQITNVSSIWIPTVTQF